MNFSLNFTEKGYGAPLILLHGNGESSGYFVNQIDRNKPFTLETFADDLKNLLDSLNIEKANILGFSDGGNIAVIFALKYPERVASLVLNGANLFPSGLKSSFLIPVKVLFAVFSLLSHFSRRAKRRSELLYLMAKQPNIQPERLSGIKCPVLVIAGTQDVIKEKHTKLIAASLPDSSLCFLKGGHSIAKTNSVEFNSTVEKFLNSL